MAGLTPLDIALLILLGWFGFKGFARGFVEEVLSLLAWVVAIVAVRLFLAPVTDLAGVWIGPGTVTSMSVFFSFFALSYLAGRMVARWVGERSRGSFMGPVDRVLGVGFGLVKGLLIASVAFLGFNLAYNVVYGVDGERPAWLAGARSFALLNAGADALSQLVRNRDQLDKAEDMFVNPPNKKSPGK